MSRTLKDCLLLSAIVVISTSLVWLPFLRHITTVWGIPIPCDGFATILKNYDGLNYIIVAKSLYHSDIISQFGQNLPSQYFAAHFPGFPLAMRLFGQYMSYLHSMLAVSVLFTITAALSFYFLLKELGIQQRLWLSTLFLFLPARWLVVRSIGSPEPMFLTFILLSMLFFTKALARRPVMNFFYAGSLGAFAVFTKSPGILLFIGYAIYLVYFIVRMQYRGVENYLTTTEIITPEVDLIAVKSSRSARTISKQFILGSIFLLLIPATLFGIFYWYSNVYHDFFAYFHSGDNIHLNFPPFQVFNKTQPWVGDIWIEDVLFYFFIYGLAFLTLIKKGLYHIASFVGIFFLATISVAHRDIARYSLPMAPFAIIAFSDFLSSKIFKIVFIVLIGAIYLYAINFITFNAFPVPSLAPYQWKK